MQKRFIYNFFIFLGIFALALLLPIFLLIDQNSKELLTEMDRIYPLMPEQKIIFERITNSLEDNLVSLSFYVFMTAFLLSLFLGRKLINPIRQLYKGAMSIKEGNLDISLNPDQGEELREVTAAFNEMAASLRKKTEELLWKDRYVSMMTDPLWVLDNENMVIDINPAFTRLLGYEKDEITGFSCFDFVDEENERVLRRNLVLIADGMSPSFEISLISKAGESMPVLVSGALIQNEKNEPLAKIGIMKDFRRETHLRNELREASEQRRGIMDSLPEILIVVDPSLRIIMANKAAEEFSPMGLLGRHCYEVFHSLPMDCMSAQARECPALEVFRTGRPAAILEERVEKEKLLFKETLAYPLKDESGAVKSAIVISRDITEKKQFEKEIELKNKELVALLSLTKILNRSLRAEEIFGPVLERVIELFHMDGGGIFFLDDDVKELTCRFHKGLSQEYAKSIEKMLMGEDIPGRVAATAQAFTSPDLLNDRRAQGSRFLAAGIRACASFPIFGREKVIGVFCLFSWSPHLFSREEENTISSVGEITAMAFENIRLYEGMRLLYQSQKRRRGEEQRELLEIASAISDKLEIKDMLESALSMLRKYLRADFAWFAEMGEDGGWLVLKSATEPGLPEGEPICPYGKECMEMDSIERKGPLIIPDLGKNDSRLSGLLAGKNFKSAFAFPVIFEGKAQAVISFFSLQHREPREEDIFFLQTAAGILGMAIERARLHKRLREEAERLKAEFAISLSRKLRAPLTGIIGLSEMLIDEEAAGQAGKTYLETIRRQGERISELMETMLYPSIGPEAKMVRARAARVQSPPQMDELNPRKSIIKSGDLMSKVMIIDDEPFILMMIEDKLKRGGLRVVTHRQSVNAVERVRTEKPDLIILDWMMPEISGLEVLKSLKEDTELKHIPVIMLTAKAQEDEEKLGLSYGVEKYITKPFSPKKLLQDVLEILEKTQAREK
jgi:PAS domain S-box-containing protein